MPHSPQGVLSASSAHGDGNSWPQVIASLGKDQRALALVQQRQVEVRPFTYGGRYVHRSVHAQQGVRSRHDDKEE